MSAPIYLETSGHFAEIVLNKPEKRNALSIDTWARLPGFIKDAESNNGVKVIIIHGGKSGAFAAGADISEFEEIYATSESAAASGRVMGNAMAAVENCAKPVLAAIEGPCVGGGVSLAMCADIRIAAETAKFGVTPAKLGLVYPAADTRRLMQCIGISKTKDLLFTGRIFPADEALSMGLVDRLSSSGKALSDARNFGDEIAAVSQWSNRAIKQMIKGLQSGWSDDSAEAMTLFTDGFGNSDFEEGRKAFLEKRHAKFTL